VRSAHARWCGEDGQRWPSLPDSVDFLASDRTTGI
jgi:hypothetical protein